MTTLKFREITAKSAAQAQYESEAGSLWTKTFVGVAAAGDTLFAAVSHDGHVLRVTTYLASGDVMVRPSEEQVHCLLAFLTSSLRLPLRGARFVEVSVPAQQPYARAFRRPLIGEG